MNRIVIIISNSPKKYVGNLFYLEEIGQYIYDNITTNVFVKNESKIEDINILYDRYDFIVPKTNEIKENDIVITDYRGLESCYNNGAINYINQIYVTASDGIKYYLEDFRNVINAYKYRNKITFLVEYNYHNTLDNYVKYINLIEYGRGFYFKHLLPTVYSDEWLLFKSDESSAYMYNNETLVEAMMYLKKNKMKFIIDSMVDRVDLCRTCKGLIYIRNHDFMPRFPYEFWYYKKPVIFFDVSDGLKKRFDDLELHKPIIKDIEKYKVNLEGLKFE